MYRQPYPLSWTIPIYLPLPGIRTRPLRIVVPNLTRLHHFTVARFGRKRGTILLCFAFLAVILTTFALAKRFGTEEKQWPKPFIGDPPTLIFGRENLQRIWKWEITSGHYPSRRRIPEGIGLRETPDNPALPPRKRYVPSRFRPPAGPISTTSNGIGPRRIYLDIQSRPPNVAYPPRPVPGSIADLDVIMEHCDFGEKKYVRDCLEVLRVGAGLDNGNRVRRGKMDDWKYIYVEQVDNSTHQETAHDDINKPVSTTLVEHDSDPNAGLTKRRGAEWEKPLVLPQPLPYRPYSTLPEFCDEDNPRMFHMFWTGPFTDKPYLALLSFLFTQNVGLHLHEHEDTPSVCRPKFWLWINPGPAAAIPNPSAIHDMFEQLKSNPWASPFLHPRFKNVIQFKLWNTTEQLDGVPELKDEWRSKDLFNSGGQVINVPANKQKEPPPAAVDNETAAMNASPTGTGSLGEDDLLNRTGSKSPSTYDRLSVILSDMARFILCHRYGGIYLDADTIFLRDWEELWNWKGAFAYRWSRWDKYNTAVLRLNKNSALGTFLFRTALKNDLDFHPMTVSRYIREAHLDGLLLRLPDALFDAAWLNTEWYQRERPPQPYFTDFGDFFDTPTVNSAAPQALGFEGFFRGSFSYHFHNFWWRPFDPARNWPDLGTQFIAGERKARAATPRASITVTATDITEEEDSVSDDRRDLDWATVLKRTFEAYIRGERPNMYGEWLQW